MHNAEMQDSWQNLKSPHERLQWARRNAGYRDAVDAAEAMGVKESTYLGHENGSRGLARAGERYAKFFKVSLDWLVANRGSPRPPMPEPLFEAEAFDETPPKRMIPIIGYVGAGAQTHFYVVDGGQIDEVEAPPGATERTVGLEIRGESLGPVFDRWVATYDDIHDPPNDRLVGRLCVVGLQDGRILVKVLHRSKKLDGLYRLISNNSSEPPIEDIAINWAARVRTILQKH